MRYAAAYRSLWCIAAAVTSSRAEADDIVQSAAVAGLERRERFQVGTDFLAWMGQIVRFMALNHARQHRRHRHLGASIALATASRFTDSGECPSGELVAVGLAGLSAPEASGFDTRLLQALDELGETARTCLLLRLILEMSFRQIGAIMEIPEGTAMSHVHRARARLRERLATRSTEGQPLQESARGSRAQKPLGERP